MSEVPLYATMGVGAKGLTELARGSRDDTHTHTHKHSHALTTPKGLADLARGNVSWSCSRASRSPSLALALAPSLSHLTLSLCLYIFLSRFEGASDYRGTSLIRSPHPDRITIGP